MRRLLLLVILCLINASALAAPREVCAGIFLSPGREIICTADTYRSRNISVELTAMRYENSDVYVADIHIRTLQSLQRAYGGGQWKKKTAAVSAMARDSGAILAITGDSGQNFTAGWNIGNGVVWRDTPNSKRDLAVLYDSGVLETIPAADLDFAVLSERKAHIWQTFLFGPVLLDENGCAMDEFNTTVGRENPRSAIGYYAPGHYCFVQADGRRTKSALEERKTNAGLTMQQLSALMESLGCTSAYNLDGGQSSMLWFGGEVISTPYRGGRRVGDIVLLREVD